MKIVKLVNRLSKPFTFQYNAEPYTVVDELLVPEEVGRHGLVRSVVVLDPFTNATVCGLGIRTADGKEELSACSALDLGNRVEVLDRSVMPDGDKMQPKTIVNPIQRDFPREDTGRVVTQAER